MKRKRNKMKRKRKINEKKRKKEGKKLIPVHCQMTKRLLSKMFLSSFHLYFAQKKKRRKKRKFNKLSKKALYFVHFLKIKTIL